MPEICRFFGIVIAMYWEAGVSHHQPHFHARYQEHQAAFSIDPVELIAGSLPRKQLRLVEGWAEMHLDELKENWALLANGNNPKAIIPLH